MLHAKLVREGFKVNVKVVERIYREERLWLRRTKRKKIPKELVPDCSQPTVVIGLYQRRAGKRAQVQDGQPQR